MQRDLGNGYELDDDPARIDRDAVHRYLSGADVYVLPEHRGRGLGVEMFRFAVLEGPLVQIRKWGLHTRDAHELYRRFGFGDPDGRYMERWNRPDD
jgi:GNAT superfamily N-acetyltransferase